MQLPNLKMDTLTKKLPNLKMMVIPQSGIASYEKVAILGTGKIEFGERQIMNEYGFSEVKNFGIGLNGDDPTDASLFLVPNVINGISLEWDSDGSNPFISVREFLKKNKILHKDFVDYEIYLKAPWIDPRTKETMPKNIIVLYTSFKGDSLEEEIISSKNNIMKNTEKTNQELTQIANDYDSKWTWPKKIKFVLSIKDEPLKCVEIINCILLYEPTRDKTRVSNSISSALAGGVDNKIFKKIRTKGDPFRYSLAD